MQDRDLYNQILGLRKPWSVLDVDLDAMAGQVTLTIGLAAGAELACPDCEKARPRYDARLRRWRHLDTCQFQTILEADVPRVECPEHGVKQVRVPWAEPGSRFTALMEAVVIDWLRAMGAISAVAKQMRLSWGEVDSIMARAVKRGLARRQRVRVECLGVDETSFQRRHEYVTIVTDFATGTVLHVADDRKRESLASYFRSLSRHQLEAIESVAMDMWGAFIAVTREFVPDADRKIAFDKFHVAQHLGDALDRVRREEHRKLLEEGNDVLKGSKFLWLSNSGNLDPAQALAMDAFQNMNLRTGRAWALKESAMCIWHYVSRSCAKTEWAAWLSKAMRSRLEPMKKVARMIRTHLWGIVNAMALRTTNAGSESVNAKVQRIKRTACGFRNRERFRNAIYFHLGGLELHPAVSG